MEGTNMDFLCRRHTGLPARQGLYDPDFEHGACGVGFVVNVKGERSNEIVRQSLTVLRSMAHRGAIGSDPGSGDGAGVLMQVPHRFLKRVCAESGIQLPLAGQYGVGMVFLPRLARDRAVCEQRIERIVKEQGQLFLGWRTVPTDVSVLGPTAASTQPCVRQVFIGRDPRIAEDMDFERKLYVIRKRVENATRRSQFESDLGRASATGCASFYICSLSARTLVYKGMLTPEQVDVFYPDLREPDIESGLVLVHSRFSTNTFPSWERAHPYRYIIHNGEINTLRGNINWVHAGQSLFKSPLFGDDLEDLLPIINPDGSDSAMLDNYLEFLVLAGRSLPHAVMMMIPEPWAGQESMSDEKKAFYEYHSALMEPWDGPATISFTDGQIVGAVLDRNGLRPSRYCVTKDDLVVLASEAGVLDIPPERVLHKGRLEPGRMLLVDTQQGCIVGDKDMKHQIAAALPYREWVSRYMVPLEALAEAPARSVGEFGRDELIRLQRAFGYTYEDLRLLLAPMAEEGIEAIGSMGTDTPLAILSERPQLLYSYFKQLFAQVTNPPIDAIREELVTSTMVLLGTEQNLLDPGPESCRQIKLESPVLTNRELARLRDIQVPGFRSRVLPILFPVAEGSEGLEKAMTDLYLAANQAISNGANILILSDRGVTASHAPIPALLAVSGLHHHLIRVGLRTRVCLILESGEPREVHHFASLVGYGASAVNPYLAYDTIDDMIGQGVLKGIDYDTAEKNYVKAIVKGTLKVASKMGISTLQSYCGAQIFEAVGLSHSMVNKYFTWTSSRLDGIGIDTIASDAGRRHALAFPGQGIAAQGLDAGGEYQWRHDGEHHLFNPQSIHLLQHACRHNDYSAYKQYSQAVSDSGGTLGTLRDLLEFVVDSEPVPMDEVESVESICRRFKTGAMSYGSISKEAHEALAIAMNRIHGKSNTGEGGEDPARHQSDGSGDSRNSAIKQVASGRFGVTSQYLVSAQEIQIKMAQGAKPGEGGQLPGRKVYPWIAKVRYSTPGVGLISPPPHHDIYSIEDLAELIYDLKNANPDARISVKLVSEVGVGTVAAGVAKGKADVVLISGFDGGTGASPRSSIKHAGLPWELGVAETHQTLVLNDLRSRITVETDGQLKTGRDVVVAALLGAEEYGFATAPLVSLGCMMMRVCHLDTCPAGIATQNPELRKKFTGDPQHVVNFMCFIAQEVREIMAQLGFRSMDEMIGRTEKLRPRDDITHDKAKLLDLSVILHQPAVSPAIGRRCTIVQDHELDKTLDRRELLGLCRPALEEGKPVSAEMAIRNTNRVVGTILGSEITRRYGGDGLPTDTIQLKFNGSAGQSFGAFIPRGLTLILEGEANDYVGKGLSGGHVIIYPPGESTFAAEENVIVGNVAFYGATGGEAYVRGLAGERFCVRNSGVRAVVEGVGDHGCEYMTGGRVVVLGRTGPNFAAGMSGGIAYVLDEHGDFAQNCNLSMVELLELEGPDEIATVHGMIQKHRSHTGSLVAERLLAHWPATVASFVKVMPKDYKRMLQAFEQAEASGMSGDDAVMAAFELNKNDLLRVRGN